jgi:Gamma-glutamyl cyclotransferase, AIG2-like
MIVCWLLPFFQVESARRHRVGLTVTLCLLPQAENSRRGSHIIAIMLPNLFVYGTLMAPEVVQTLIGRLPKQQPARLFGYRRHPVKSHVFPGLIAVAPTSAGLAAAVTDDSNANSGSNSKISSSCNGIDSFPVASTTEKYGGTTAVTEGILYSGLTEEEMERFDFFEGSGYTKRMCRVELMAGAAAGAAEMDRGESEEDGGKDTPSPIQTTTTALVYLWSNPVSELDVDQVWDYERFYKTKLEWYLDSTVRPCREEIDQDDQ